MRATSNIGNSGWSTATGTPKAVPDAPGEPTLTAGDRTIDVSWTEPTTNGSAITDYDVQYRKQKSDNTWPTSWLTLSHTGTGTAANMTSLTNGSAYQVRVRAENGNGEGPWSSAATATPAGKPAKPDAPSLTAGDGSLTVTWTAPSDNGSAITGYKVARCTSTDDCTDDGNWTEDSPDSVITTHTLTGLTNGTAYKVRVRATNDVDDGPWSKSATGTPAGPPYAPDTVTLASGNGRLIVTWSAPTTNGATVSGFKVRHCDSDDNTKDCWSDYDDWTTVTVSGATARSTTITGLTNNNLISVKVMTLSTVNSEWTSSESGTPGGPNGPSTPSLSAGDQQITVTWTAPAKNHSDISQYEVGYCNHTDGDCADGIWTNDTHTRI